MNIEKNINELANIRSEMDMLKKREAELTNEIKNLGPGNYDGSEHYAVVSETTRETLDMKAVRKKLSRQFIKANTNTSTSIQLRLYGYSRKAVA
tara:strand:- start:593 stop:874 length:282 start_codon:yes stop_codon:yes gene_type:complete